MAASRAAWLRALHDTKQQQQQQREVVERNRRGYRRLELFCFRQDRGMRRRRLTLTPTLVGIRKDNDDYLTLAKDNQHERSKLRFFVFLIVLQQ